MQRAFLDLLGLSCDWIKQNSLTHTIAFKTRPRPFFCRSAVAALAAFLTCLSAQADDSPLKFRDQVIDPKIGRVCYAVTLADVNGDGLLDAVAVSENQVIWYMNPTWEKRLILDRQTVADNVCITEHDIDGDGQIDFVIGAGWTGANTGTIQWLQRGATLDELWKVHHISAEPSLHRMRFADVLGTGRPQLTVTPLMATQPAGIRFLAFEIPENPTTDRWPETILSQELNRVHNHTHHDLDNDGSIESLTASQEGVTIYRRTEDGQAGKRLELLESKNSMKSPGAGEIKVGRLPNGRNFIVTVEPMHGTMLAIYTPTSDDEKLWKRSIIDDDFQRGHALAVADMNGDGKDDIIFGHSDTPGKFGVRVYLSASDDGSNWSMHLVDEGQMATEDLVVGDLNGDGLPEILAGGRSTQNVKIYWNETSVAEKNN